MDTLRSAKGALEATVVVVSLVHTLVDSFGSMSDLYRKLKKKEDKSFDSRYDLPDRRRREDDIEATYGRRRRRREDDYEDSDEESIYNSGSLIRQEYDRGYSRLGEQFAVGDLVAQNQLQGQIITLQQTIIAIFQDTASVYGPKHEPVSHHLTRLLNASRAARAAAVDALTQQRQRMLNSAPQQLALPTSSRLGRSRSLSRPRSRSSESTITIISSPSSTGARASTHGLYCIYSQDLQNHSEQLLADNFREGGNATCPFCTARIPIRPGKTWELIKEHERDRLVDRVFHVEPRFVVKSHRDGGGYACVLCSRYRTTDTTCESISSLIDHVWQEHKAREYEREVDIIEVT
ncbi:hypothetical protein AOQ84DRAFT_220367 [Glonium stellatum]|uniref:Uncharacterized protein n=1 Tax=Glonium stellatum TaxID=574774 RepID=A0A8E2JLQ9_9PEZI|nr:hypothetical protein AOQ84DRAFT_220367 [Glonium stellatum]